MMTRTLSSVLFFQNFLIRHWLFQFYFNCADSSRGPAAKQRCPRCPRAPCNSSAGDGRWLCCPVSDCTCGCWPGQEWRAAAVGPPQYFSRSSRVYRLSPAVIMHHGVQSTVAASSVDEWIRSRRAAGPRIAAICVICQVRDGGRRRSGLRGCARRCDLSVGIFRTDCTACFPVPTTERLGPTVLYSPNSTWFVTSRHVSTRLDAFDVSSESRRACRAVLFQHGGRRTSYSARLCKFSRFYALTYTNPICSFKWINEINIYFNKLVNHLHIITLYKLHNKLSCESRLSRSSRRACRAVLFDFAKQNAWARHVERVESCRVETWRANWNLGYSCCKESSRHFVFLHSQLCHQSRICFWLWVISLLGFSIYQHSISRVIQYQLSSNNNATIY